MAELHFRYFFPCLDRQRSLRAQASRNAHPIPNTPITSPPMTIDHRLFLMLWTISMTSPVLGMKDDKTIATSTIKRAIKPSMKATMETHPKYLNNPLAGFGMIHLRVEMFFAADKL
jgi:hypothetical protein